MILILTPWVNKSAPFLSINFILFLSTNYPVSPNEKIGAPVP
jgi:hypothetical protein